MVDDVIRYYLSSNLFFADDDEGPAILMGRRISLSLLKAKWTFKRRKKKKLIDCSAFFREFLERYIKKKNKVFRLRTPFLKKK